MVFTQFGDSMGFLREALHGNTISPQLPSAVIAPAHRAAISWSATSVQVGDNDKPHAGVPGRLRAALLRSRRFSSRGLFAE